VTIAFQPVAEKKTTSKVSSRYISFIFINLYIIDMPMLLQTFKPDVAFPEVVQGQFLHAQKEKDERERGFKI